MARRLVLIVIAFVLAFAVLLLLDSRPPLPSTASGIAGLTNGLLGFIAWVGGLLLALGLLARLSWRSHVHGETPIRDHQPGQRMRRRFATSGGYPDRAFPLIPRPDRRLEDGKPDDASTKFNAKKPAGKDPISSSDASPPARISILGPLTITGGQRHSRRLRGATRELLTYLALHPNGASRDQITDALWPDQPPERGRNRLWRAVADARHHLGDTILSRETDHYQLDRNEISVDLDQLENILAALARDEAKESLPVLEEAVALFRGEPLAGSDLTWAENEQRRLTAVMIDLLERAGRARLRDRDPAGALAATETGLTHDPYNERLVQLAMEAEAALDLRAAIVSRYAALEEALDQELGLQPKQDTRALYRRLLAQG